MFKVVTKVLSRCHFGDSGWFLSLFWSNSQISFQDILGNEITLNWKPLFYDGCLFGGRRVLVKGERPQRDRLLSHPFLESPIRAKCTACLAWTRFEGGKQGPDVFTCPQSAAQMWPHPWLTQCSPTSQSQSSLQSSTQVPTLEQTSWIPLCFRHRV